MAVKSLEDINDELKNRKEKGEDVEEKELDNVSEQEEADEELEAPPRKFTKREEGDPLDDESGSDEPAATDEESEDELDDLKAQDLAKPTFIKEETSFDSAQDKEEEPVSQETFKRSLNEEPAGEGDEKTLDDLAEEEGKGEYDEIHIPNLRSNQASGGNVAPTNYMDEPPASRNPFPEKYYPHRKRASWWHLLVLALIGVVVIIATVFLLKNQLKSSLPFLSKLNPAPTATPTPAPTATPSPTPQPLDRSKFKIRVLNGTTKAGLAASESAKLKDLGYQIDKAGNASTQDYKTTQIKVKSAAKELGDQLVKDLAPDFTASTSGILKESDTADGEVILGLK